MLAIMCTLAVLHTGLSGGSVFMVLFRSPSQATSSGWGNGICLIHPDIEYTNIFHFQFKLYQNLCLSNRKVIICLFCPSSCVTSIWSRMMLLFPFGQVYVKCCCSASPWLAKCHQRQASFQSYDDVSPMEHAHMLWDKEEWGMGRIMLNHSH